MSLLAYQPCLFLGFPKTNCVSKRSPTLVCRFKCSKATNPNGQSTYYKKNIYTFDFVDLLQTDYQGRTNVEPYEELKELVKNMLIDVTVGSPTTLELIDNLERLGVAYHFEQEIKRALDLVSIHKDACIKGDLHCTALYYRLLRHHGYKVSQDVFNGFMDETGSFKLGLCEDVKGLLSLYEASHLCFQGEDILDKAKDFTIKHLKHLNENIDPGLAKEVARSLELPLHHRMPRLEVTYYLDVYQKEDKMNPILLKFAQMDFNMLQTIYQKELSHMSRWWKHLGLSDELSFARDRIVESFLVAVGVTYKPQHQCCREWLTKVVCLIIVIDDIYDIYGTLDELELFTDAVERWDLKAMEQLPDYMIVCFLALFNMTNDIVFVKYKDRRLDILSHLKKVWADLCKAMLVEAKWCKMRYTPSLAEYLENAWISASTPVVLVHAFFGTDQIATNDVVERLNNKPYLIYRSSMILRLCNDLATSSAELERGDVPSAIQCYMHESKASEEIARSKINGLVTEFWKKLNKSIYNSPFDDSFVNIAVNSARTAHNIYRYGDGIGVQHHAKEYISEILVKPARILNS